MYRLRTADLDEERGISTASDGKLKMLPVSLDRNLTNMCLIFFFIEHLRLADQLSGHSSAAI